MRIDIERIGGVSIIEIPGTTLDASNTEDFREAIDMCMQPDSRVVFDLHELQFVDSSGIGVLLTSLRELHSMGGDAKLCGMVDSVLNMFRLVRMDRVFDIHGTREEATAAF